MRSVDVALDDVHASYGAQHLARLARSSKRRMNAPWTTVARLIGYGYCGSRACAAYYSWRRFSRCCPGVVATAHYQPMSDRGGCA